MNSMPTIQFRYDLWYVEGGLYNIALGLKRLMEELGIKVHLNSEIAGIEKAKGTVTGITLKDGSFRPADIIVSNMEVIPAYKNLLTGGRCLHAQAGKIRADLLRHCPRYRPRHQYPQLAHHNFFFSGDQRENFKKVFRKYELPDDPSIYLVAASKTDPTVAPAGCDCLKILPHIPHIDDEKPLTREDYGKFKELIVDKLERMGLKDLRKHIVYEHFLDAAGYPRAILFQQGIDLRGGFRSFQKISHSRRPSRARVTKTSFLSVAQ